MKDFNINITNIDDVKSSAQSLGSEEDDFGNLQTEKDSVRNTTPHCGHSHTISDNADKFPLKHALYSLPFICIFVLSVASDHVNGLLVVFGLFVHVFYMNMKFRSIIEDNNRKMVPCIIALLGLGETMILLYLLRHEGFYRVLFCFPPIVSLTNWLEALWCMVVVDYSLKNAFCVIKSVILLLPHVDFLKRSTMMASVEHISILYRCLPPIIPWMLFLTEATASIKRRPILLRILFGLLYSLAKAVSLFLIGRRTWKFFSDIPHSLVYSVRYVTSTTDEKCCLCFEGGMLIARLPCQHVLCAHCAERWLNSFLECPTCQTKFVGDTTWRDGSTSILCRFY